MKSLIAFAKKHNLKIGKVRYKHQFGYCKRKGYDILTTDNYILASFEPTELLDSKWYLRHKHENYKGPDYINRITTKFLESFINPDAKSFFKNSTPIIIYE